MQTTYPDLAAGRFISLADFESPGQDRMFRQVNAAGAQAGEQPGLSVLRSRNETGAGSVKAHLASSEHRLLFDGQRSDRFALVRDWSRYALLLLSIYGPDEGLTLEFTVHSGDELPTHWSRTIHARPGWNLYRFDVATIGDRCDLTDVRALAWQAPDISQPVSFYIDDIILADNSETLVAAAGAEALHIQTRGQRIHVAAPGRFELQWADGVIVTWRDAATLNLADVDGLGPWPVPLPVDWAATTTPPIAYDDPAHFAAWGAQVATTQRLVEATPFRAVIEGQWRFLSPGADTSNLADLPGHRWRYVIYPSGCVYVSLRSQADAAGWPDERLGFAVGLDGRRGFAGHFTPPATPREPPTSFALAARARPQAADLLWTWPRTTNLPHRRELASTDGRRLALLVGALEPTDVVETAHLLRVWPTDIDDTPEALTLTRAYQQPVALAPTAGTLVTDAPGDANHDGFNEAEGLYELAAADGVLRCRFDPGGLLRFDPVFRVRGTARRQCWVYARGRLVERTGRDADDRLLFTLGHVVSAPLTIEVHAPAKED